MAKFSTGLRNAMLDTASLKTKLDGGFLKVYSGTPPASADDAIASGNTLLLTFTLNGDGVTGLTFAAAAASGALVKSASEVWKGTVAATGTASFQRFVASTDDGTASTTAYRIQGTISTDSTGDAFWSSVNLVQNDEKVYDNYTVVLPTL